MKAHRGFQSIPAFAEGFVFVGSFGGRFHALDPKNGSERWGGNTEGPMRGAPLYVDGKVYYITDNGYVDSVK